MSDVLPPADAPTLQDGRYSITHGKQTLHYEVVNGVPLFQGDIVLRATSLPEGSTSLRPLVMREGEHWRWRQGIVPYTIDSSITSGPRSRITSAIAHWQTNTPIRFVPRTATNASMFPDYVTFRGVDANHSSRSSIGRIGGQQFIDLSVADNLDRTIRHEMGHAIGMFHTHVRPDRNSFVTILWDNIIDTPFDRSNFTILPFGEGNLEITPYDYASIMHYHDNARSIDPATKLTILTLGGQQLAQSSDLSPLDIANVTATYGAPAVMPVDSQFVTGFASSLTGAYRAPRVRLGAILAGRCNVVSAGSWQLVSGADANSGVLSMSMTSGFTPAYYWVKSGPAGNQAYSCAPPAAPALIAPPAGRVFRDIAVTRFGSEVWTTATDGTIWKGSTRIAGPANHLAVHIAVNPESSGDLAPPCITTNETAANVYSYVPSTGRWTRLGTLHADDVGIGGDGVAWAVNSGGLYRWVGTGWLQVDDTAKASVAVTPYGDPLTADAQGNGYGFDTTPYSTWWQMPQSSTQSSIVDVAVGQDGHLHAIDGAGGFQAWLGSFWALEFGPWNVPGAVAADFRSITMFAVAGASVFVRGEQNWTFVIAGTVTLIDVAVVASDKAYVCTANAIFSVTTGAAPYFLPVVPYVDKGLKRISVAANGHIWWVDGNGGVSEYAVQVGGGTKIDRGTPSAIDINCGVDGFVWIVTQEGRLARWNPESSDWDWQSTALPPVAVRSLANDVDDSGLIWVVGTDGCVYQRLN